MNIKTHNLKYRLLVLMDMSKASENALKNAVQLAKVINGSVEVLHVKSPTDVVKHENQFSAIRAIHEDYNKTKSRLRRIVKKLEKNNDISIMYKVAYGNIKNGIKEYIDERQPEIVLLGKHKDRLANFLSRGITNFVLKQCSNILIVGEDQKFHSYNDIFLGVYGEMLEQEGIEIISDLKRKNTNPVRIFNIQNQKNLRQSNTTLDSDRKKVSYVFSEGTNALNGLASYVMMTNTQLLCVPKKSNINSLQQMIQKLDIPLLFLEH